MRPIVTKRLGNGGEDRAATKSYCVTSDRAHTDHVLDRSFSGIESPAAAEKEKSGVDGKTVILIVIGLLAFLAVVLLVFLIILLKCKSKSYFYFTLKEKQLLELRGNVRVTHS